MAHTPLKMTIEEAHAELNYGWAQSYSPEALAQAVAALDDHHVGDRFNISWHTSLFSRDLFPDADEIIVAARGCREPPNDPEAAQSGSVPWMRPGSFAGRDSFDVGSQCQRRSQA
jgi:hypothetical protein